MGAKLFWELFHFFQVFFFWFGGGFRAVQAPFWGNPGVKCRFRVAFQDTWGCFSGCPASDLGKPVVKGGEMQVSCGLDRKNCCKKHFSRSFLFSVCVYLRMFVCVCVCNRVCSISLFFLLLFCFLIQCTSFLVFAVYYI